MNVTKIILAAGIFLVLANLVNGGPANAADSRKLVVAAAQTPNLDGLAQEGMDIPLVVIDVNGGFSIPDEPKIKAQMKLIDHGPGQLNFASDSGNIYHGNIGIEIRGAYSASLPQKPYGFETRDELGENNNVALWHMPPENDWTLVSNYNDKFELTWYNIRSGTKFSGTTVQGGENITIEAPAENEWIALLIAK